MKYFLIIFFSISLFDVFGQNKLSKVNQFIDSDQFEEAVELLTQITEEYPGNVQVLSNLGYAYFQIGDLANSVLYYEKALKINPRDVEIIEALKMVRSQLPNQITEIPDFVLLRFYRSLVNVMSASAWAIIQVIAAGGTLLFLYFTLFRNDRIRWTATKTSLMGLLILVTFLSGLFGYHKSQNEGTGWSAISMEFQNLYEAPDQRSNLITDIGPGNKVYILDSLETWYKVQLTDKDVGWLKMVSVKLI